MRVPGFDDANAGIASVDLDMHVGPLEIVAITPTPTFA